MLDNLRFFLSCAARLEWRMAWHYCRVQHALFGPGFLVGRRDYRGVREFLDYLKVTGRLQSWIRHEPRWYAKVSRCLSGGRPE